MSAGCAWRRMSPPEHFHIPAHATIYEVLLELWNANKPIDFITLTQVLRDRNLLDGVGGAAFVTNLFTFLPTAANAAYYIEIVQEKYTLRQIITTCTEYAARSYEEQESVPTLLDEVEQHIFEIAKDRFKAKIQSMKDQVMDAIESIEQLYERRGSITGLPTGFGELDKMTDGLHGAEMFVIAARPSMGKTALAMNIAEHVGAEREEAGRDFLAGNEQPAARAAAALLARAGESPARARRVSQRARFPESDGGGVETGGEQNLHR